MKSFVLALTLLLTPALFAQQAVPEIPFDSVPNFFKLPADLHFGEASGVAVNSKGHIFVFNRGNTTGPAYGATAAQILEFGPDGKYIREVGKKEASDDGAEPWKRVNPPRPPVDGQFRQPTDVTWDTQGNIFISDGYINSRVAKFDKNGDWVKSW